MNLLDTPKKKALEQQSAELRLALKAFERRFTEQHGSKPKQKDIKNDPIVASKYKQYQRVQDALAGKLAYEKVNEANVSKKVRGSKHGRHDGGIGSSPRKHLNSQHSTPKKSGSLQVAEVRSPGSEVSPRPELLYAIGPTPHRDGKVVGLFDLLQRSGSGKSSAVTPSSSARKRKLDELYRDTPARRSPLKVIQTPSRHSEKQQGDLLEYLEGTPEKSLDKAAVKHSRTPQSNGRKFQLSQFFATPSTQRFTFQHNNDALDQKTPLRDLVLGQTPERQPENAALDTTPTYLRRSTSFKDRLLSASNTASTAPANEPFAPLQRIGPPTLRHFRSSTENILKVTDLANTARKPQSLSCSRSHAEEESDHEDDLDALHEMEAEDDFQGRPSKRHILVQDSQHDLSLDQSSDLHNVDFNHTATELIPARRYKKKGQKRTTRKSNIRPTVQSKPSAQPKFVAADSSDNDDQNSETEFDGGFDSDEFEHLSKEQSTKKSKTNETERSARKKTEKPSGHGKSRAGMINPNAQSHMNFRTLKIKNKNSKAKGPGRGRFSRGRR